MSVWSDGWLDGFIACGALMAGHRKQYEKMRDEYLDRKPSVTEAREVIQRFLDHCHTFITEYQAQILERGIAEAIEAAEARGRAATNTSSPTP